MSTYTLEQYPDPAALIGGYTTYPVDYPHPIYVVSHTGTAPWPQTVKYTGSPISATVYSPSNSSYDKNTLIPPLDVLPQVPYQPTAGLPQPASIPVMPGRQYESLAWWKIALVGGLSATAIGLFIFYLWLHNKR